MEKARILIVEDDEVSGKNLTRLLVKEEYKVSCVGSGAEAVGLIEKNKYDVVLTDLVMDGVGGIEVLEKTKLACPDTEVILFTGYASIPTAIEAIRKGAYHYLEKPFRLDEVRHLVSQAVEKCRLRRQVVELENKVLAGSTEQELIGHSREMAEVVRLVGQIAQADCNVLLTGESGTGKELAASMIHRMSRRNEGKFLAINCGAFTEELLANELFGHDKDAFTGATSSKPGLLESAESGTILLDEVGDMPLSMQVKLLRAIQEQEIIRVGGNKSVPIDVRIVAATNKDLKKAVKADLFRQDLYFRLNVVNIHIPPLREHKSDIPILAAYFLAKAARKSGMDTNAFSDDAMRVLMQYDYPGNVRELENIVERAVALAHENVIQVTDLPPDLSEIEIFSFEHSDSKLKTLKDIERDYIQWVLTKTGRNKTKAAKILGVDRASLWRHLKRHEIEE